MPTLREYIQALQALEEQYGPEVPVEKWMPATGRRAAPLPRPAHIRMLDKQQAGSSFWVADVDPISIQGDLRIRV